MIHYHGTPITPRSVLQSLAGKHFCVSFAASQDVEECHRIGQSVMLDNGAFSQWRRNPLAPMYVWDGYYDWVRPWLDFQTTWCVIPDVISGTEQENDALIGKWCMKFGLGRNGQAAPVWHLHESLGRLEQLCQSWERVCFGSSGEYAVIGSNKWNNRVNEAFNSICKGSGRPACWIHMLRGMSLAGSVYPFASVDSTDVAQNHNRQNNAKEMADRWDALQCPATWTQRAIQAELITI